MLSRHYAPETPTFLVENAEKFLSNWTGKKIGVILFDKKIESQVVEYQEVLSSKSDLKEAASKLYATLHKLDKLNLDMIVAQRFPDFGLGKSINDRLERATKKK